MTIITYEAQHSALIGGIPKRVEARDWNQLSLDAADLATLETLIGKAPTQIIEKVPGVMTVMAKPLP
jgi:hypothetical protein